MPTLDYGNFPSLNLESSGGKARTDNIFDPETFELWNSGARARTHSLLLLGERGVPPVLTSAWTLSATRVLVIYSMRMLRDLNLMFTPNYVITPAGGSAARTVTLVTVPHASGVYALLDLDGELTPGTNNYQVTVSNVRSLRGILIDPNEDTATFSGFSQGVDIDHIDTLPNNQLRVFFTVPVLNNAALRCLEIYSIVPNPLAIPALPPVDVLSVVVEGDPGPTDPAPSVLLTTTEHRNLANYELEIAIIEAA